MSDQMNIEKQEEEMVIESKLSNDEMNANGQNESQSQGESVASKIKSQQHKSSQHSNSEQQQKKPMIHEQMRAEMMNPQMAQSLGGGMYQEQQQNQVFTYKAPWQIYSMGFSSRPTSVPRIGIGSMNDDIHNEVYILHLDKDNDNINEKFEMKGKFNHQYAPTKLMWIPDTSGCRTDLLATSGESLKIYEIDSEGVVKQKHDLVNQSEFNCPLTSFDWNCKQQNYIGTASIDTTCTLWDVEKQTVFTQLIAHDKEVYDICFSLEAQIFASVGADGSCRQFDLRSLDHSTVLYETDHANPIVRLQWNKLDPNYLAIIEMDVNQITLLDTRQPLVPVAKLNNHKKYVNAIAWAPESAYHLCSIADDSSALIWDLNELQHKQEPQSLSKIDPLLEYKAESEISNLSWSLANPELLSICYAKSCQILNV